MALPRTAETERLYSLHLLGAHCDGSFGVGRDVRALRRAVQAARIQLSCKGSVEKLSCKAAFVQEVRSTPYSELFLMTEPAQLLQG